MIRGFSFLDRGRCPLHRQSKANCFQPCASCEWRFLRWPFGLPGRRPSALRPAGLARQRSWACLACFPCRYPLATGSGHSQPSGVMTACLSVVASMSPVLALACGAGSLIRCGSSTRGSPPVFRRSASARASSLVPVKSPTFTALPSSSAAFSSMTIQRGPPLCLATNSAGLGAWALAVSNSLALGLPVLASVMALASGVMVASGSPGVCGVRSGAGIGLASGWLLINEGQNQWGGLSGSRLFAREAGGVDPINQAVQGDDCFVSVIGDGDNSLTSRWVKFCARFCIIHAAGACAGSHDGALGWD